MTGVMEMIAPAAARGFTGRPGRCARTLPREVDAACPDEAELVSRILAGETRQFEEVVRTHQDAVYGFVYRMLRNRADAEDAAQEVFLRAFRGLQGFQGRSKLSTWLYRIAFNTCADRLRRRSAAGRRLESQVEEWMGADRAFDPEEPAFGAEERQAVRRAVDRLPDLYRAVVILRYYQGISISEISAALGVPPKTVETRLYRARRALRATLKELSLPAG